MRSQKKTHFCMLHFKGAQKPISKAIPYFEEPEVITNLFGFLGVFSQVLRILFKWLQYWHLFYQSSHLFSFLNTGYSHGFDLRCWNKAKLSFDAQVNTMNSTGTVKALCAITKNRDENDVEDYWLPIWLTLENDPWDTEMVHAFVIPWHVFYIY